MKAFDFKHPVFINGNEIKQFLLLQGEKSDYYQNLFIDAIGFYYEYILRKKLSPQVLIRPLRKYSLPDILTIEEVDAMITALDDGGKHKMENPNYRAKVDAEIEKRRLAGF